MNCSLPYLLQQKNKMARQYGPIVWAQEREHHHLKEKVNFQLSVDYLNHGNGNEKRSQINSKLHHDVSFSLYPIFIS